MRYGKLILVGGALQEVDVKIIDQSKMTSDCWLIQFSGIEACIGCQCMNAKTGKRKTRGENACGGGETLRRLLAGKTV